ncbi:hypothetical protein [Brevibacillus borstelensis]
MASVKAIKLNEEQTKRFLSFFIPELIELAKKRIAEKDPEKCLSKASGS